MADERVTIGSNERAQVRLRTGGTAPSVVARQVPVATPGLSISPNTTTDQLVSALDLGNFQRINQQVLKEEREGALAEGQLARTQNQQDWAKAVESGAVSKWANPWFIKGYQEQDGRVAGLSYYTEMRGAYGSSNIRGSDDPNAFEKFTADFTKSYMQKVGNQSADWMRGFQGEMQSAQKTLAAEHVSEAEKAQTAKQETNTGAEINVILNSTRDPVEAAVAINALGEKMKAMGMPSAAFEKVAAEAILARAKMGDSGMLATLDHVATGGKGGETAQSAISRLEGSGSYTQVGNEVTYKNGTKDRAYGKYQVMGNNIPAWTKEVLGRSMTPEEFLKDGKAQEAVFQEKFVNQLEKKYGREGAARAWFAGEGGMNNLNAKDVNGMTVGQYGTLASRPAVQRARVETEQYLVEKARGDQRWKWAQEDHDWTVQQRDRAKTTQAREDERWAREKASMSREEKTRSIMTQIVTSSMADPANAYSNNRDRFKELAEIDPKAAESGAAFVDTFTQRRERVPDNVERPVLAQLQRDMVNSAGNPQRQRDLLLQANQLFTEGKIGREAMARFIDDAQRFGAWDPETQRKLQDPQVNRVRQTAAQLFTERGATSVYGSAAVDALVTEQVIDRAVLDYLKDKPTATGAELAEVATKALQGVMPTLNPNAMGGGRAADISNKVPQAQANIERKQPQDGNTPPAMPQPSVDEMVKYVDPVDAQTFIRSVQEAQQRGGLPAMLKAIADFDAAMKIPGLGQKLIDLHAKPPAPAPQKK